MIVINNVVTRDDIPFKLNDIVRDNCVIITSIIGRLIEFFRCLNFHICGWITIIRAILSIIANVVEGNNSVKFAGSKIEKISLIIKIWFIPFKALKAFSLINLRSYSEILSHNFINIGLIRK